MSENTKRLLTWIVTAAMLFSMMPMGAIAQEQTGEPIQIQTETEDPVLDALEPEVLNTTVPDYTEPDYTEPGYVEPDSTEPANPGVEIPANTAVMYLDVNMAAVISEPGASAWMQFTPAESGTYAFASESDIDPRAYLYNANGIQLAENDDGGMESNFLITYQLNAGETYYLEARYWDRTLTGAFTVKVLRFEVSSITASPLTIEEGTCGEWSDKWTEENGQEQYFSYSWYNKVQYTVTMADGTVIPVSNSLSFYYRGLEFWTGNSDGQNANPWTAGNTYYVELFVGDASTTFPVTITPSTVASITVAPVVMTENSGGNWSQEWDIESQSYQEYYQYYWWSNVSCTITFKNGETVSFMGNDFYYNDTNYFLQPTDSQHISNPWTVDNTYTGKLSLGNVISMDVPVTIQSSPIASIIFDPITMFKNTGGSWHGEWDPNTQSHQQYYSYYWWNYLSYTVTFSDGSSAHYEGTGFEYQGVWYSLNFMNDQSYVNHWTEGNTYTQTVSVAGCENTVSITIEGSPIASINVSPVTLKAGENGQISHEYNPETGLYDSYVFGYSWSDNLTYDVTMGDGTVYTGLTGRYLYHNGVEFHLENSDTQYDEPWLPGNTYFGTVTMGGTSAHVSVTILPSPFAEVTIHQPNISVTEYTNGGWQTEWNPDIQQDETYYNYWWHNQLSWTVRFIDGTTASGSGEGLWHDGEYYYFSIVGNDQYNNHWTVGNTYNCTLFLGGSQCGTVSVSITESPVESVTVHPVTLEENTGGYYNWGANGEFFYYSQWQYSVAYTIRFKDGTVAQGSYSQPVYYNGVDYRIEDYGSNQYENPWYPNSDNEASVWIGGSEYPVAIFIRSATEDNGFRYMIQNGQAIITDCTLQNTLIQIPETIDGYPVVGITSLGNALRYALEIRIPDSVTMLNGDLFVLDYYDSEVPLKKLYLGSGISTIHPDQVAHLTYLEWVDVAKNNPHLCSVDGVVYNKELTTLILFPKAKQTLHTTPDSVTNVENLFCSVMAQYTGNPNIQFGAGVADYKIVDGVIYNADMTTVIMATASAQGEYVMPDSVEFISGYAFYDSKLTSVVLSNNVTYLAYGTFCGSSLLKEITIPAGMEGIEPDVFRDCEQLEKVHVPSISDWCQISYFWDNPLRYGGYLYVDGEKIVDLVIPEDITSLPENIFWGAGFTSVTIPAGLMAIGDYAFLNCTNLERVNISDLGAWCGILFGDEFSNPLYYAEDLYLNGEVVKDLVLPEVVSNRVYPQYAGIGVGSYAFVNSSIETVTVPSGIQRLEYDAFAGCENLTKVHISDLTAWCKTEFQGLDANPLYHAGDLYLNGQLTTELVIPETVTGAVYDYAFVHGSMTKLTLPGTVTNIGRNCFQGSSVEEIDFAEGLEEISFAAFQNSAVKSLDLPDSLRYIGDDVFSECQQLETVNCGNNLEWIDWYAFSFTGIKELNLPDSLYYIGHNAFAWTENLTSVVLPSRLEFVGEYAFANSGLNRVEYTGESLNISRNAFQNCPMKDLELSENINYIDSAAFSGSMTSQVKLPASTVSLTYREFAFNPYLVSVSIPSTLEYISENAFTGSDNLSHVLYMGTQAEWDHQTYYYSPQIQGATVHLNAMGNEVTVTHTCTTVEYHCSICGMEGSIPKPNTDHIFENGVCTECGHTSQWDYKVSDGSVTITGYSGTDRNIVVPETIDGMPVTAFESYVFAYNQKIYTVELPETITSIPEGAFRNCSVLEEVIMGDQVVYIGDFAFYECNNLYNVYLPDSVRWIGDYAFANCYNLYEETLPESLIHIGDGAFAYCYRLSINAIPAGVTEIAYEAFSGCTSITQLTLPESVTSIGYYAFRFSCFTEITIPASVTLLQHSAFDWSHCLQLIKFMGEKPELADYFADSSVTVLYPATESWSGMERKNWLACETPVVTRQPETVEGWLGDNAVTSVLADGQRLNYQWYMAAPDSEQFLPVGSNSMELAVPMTAETSGSRAYCVVTDPLGQYTITDTVTLTAEEKPVMTLTSAPTKVDYLLGEELDPTGLEITLTWADGRTEVLTSCDLTGYDPSTAGTQTITAEYRGLTATFTVTVTDPYSGSCGKDATWRLEGTVLTISGTGAMANFTTKTQPWIDFRSTITSVVIEEGITSIGNCAFYYCRTLENVTIPASVTSFGSRSFYQNAKLADIFYNGTAAQWAAISQGTDNNTVLEKAAVHTVESITGITVTAPDKTQYWNGEDLDLTGMVVSVTWTDGSTEIISEGYDVTGYYKHVTGEQIVTVTYGEFTATFTVTVSDIEIVGISVTPPYKTLYTVGEELDLTGMVVVVEWSNGTFQNVTEGFAPADYDPNRAGEQEVSIFYRGFRTTFTVTVEAAVEVVLTGITVTDLYGNAYNIGQELDLDSIMILAEYSDGSVYRVFDGYQVSGFDPYIAGEQIVTVEYQGYTATFTVTVNCQGNAGDNIIWTIQEGTLSFYGNGYMLSYGCMDDQPWRNYREDITKVLISDGVYYIGDYSFEGFVNLESLIIYDSVTYIGENAFNGCDALKTIHYTGTATRWNEITRCVGNGALSNAQLFTNEEVVSIQITRIPYKTEYILGEGFDPAGMEITAFWSDGSTQTVEDYIISGYDPYTVGMQDILIEYQGFQAGFTIMVTESGITGIEVTKLPDKTEYVLGEDFDPTGMEVTAFLSDGSSSIVYDYTISGYDPNMEGMQDIYIEYQGHQAVFTILVKSLPVYCVYGHTSHEGIDCDEEFLTWTELDPSIDRLPTAAGNYYFPEGSVVNLYSTSKISADINLDLRGSTVIFQKHGSRAITVDKGSCTITDTFGGSTLTFAEGFTAGLTGYAAYATNNATLRLMGIKVDASNVSSTSTTSNISAITVNADSTFLAYGCHIIGGKAEHGVGAVNIVNSKVTLWNTTAEGGCNFGTTSGNTTTAALMGAVKLLPGVNQFGLKTTMYLTVDCTDLASESQIVANSGNYLFADSAEAATAAKTGVIVPADGMQLEVDHEYVNVTKAASVLTGITVTAPDKTEYFVYEELDTTGMVITAHYSDGTTMIITDGYEIYGYDMTYASRYDVTVSYGGFTDTFSIIVEEMMVSEKIGQIIISDSSAYTGAIVDVVLRLTANPGIASMKLKVHFDSSVLTLTEVLDGGILGDIAHKPELTSPYSLSWVNDLATEDFTEEGILVTLRFMVAEDAPEGVYTISATYDSGKYDIMDKDMVKVEMEIISGNVTVSNVLIGDVNGDGEVNTRDRAFLTRYLADWEDYQNIDLLAADVNQDGQVDTRDRAILTRYLADWDNYNSLPYTG